MSTTLKPTVIQLSIKGQPNCRTTVTLVHIKIYIYLPAMAVGPDNQISSYKLIMPSD